MILLLAGTQDARELALFLNKNGYSLLSTVVTEQGAKRLQEYNIPVHVGRLKDAQLAQMIQEKKLKVIIDASHPYAEEASKNAISAARLANIPYIRYERPSIDFKDNKHIYYVSSYEEAAQLAKEKEGVILLTTGSKTLDIFTKYLLNDPSIRLIVRLLPNVENLIRCQELGFDNQNIIAMQGPFSEDLNRAIFQRYSVSLLITKESGNEGGMAEKVKAALEMGIDTIIINRPKIDYKLVSSSFEEVLLQLQKISY